MKRYFAIACCALATCGCGVMTRPSLEHVRAQAARNLVLPPEGDLGETVTVAAQGGFVCALVPDTEMTFTDEQPAGRHADQTARLSQQCDVDRGGQKDAVVRPVQHLAEPPVVPGARPCANGICTPARTDSKGRVVLRRLWCYQDQVGRWWINAGRFQEPVTPAASP